MKRSLILLAALLFLVGAKGLRAGEAGKQWFVGKHYRGRGDAEYLRLLETARRMFEPDPELQNMSMLYMPAWNGFVEGPTWDAWWIQNSYGTTYCALPFYQEPFVTFLQNAQDLWFNQMGDGKHVGSETVSKVFFPVGFFHTVEYAGRWVSHFAIRLIVVVKESSDQRTSSRRATSQFPPWTLRPVLAAVVFGPSRCFCCHL